MGFFNKTQAELDAAFLNAVTKHKFDKAKKLLEKGANVLAVDAELNAAFHKLAGCYDAYRHEYAPLGTLCNPAAVDEFVCFLLTRGVPINAANKQGQTCLHATLEDKEDRKCDLLNIFLNRGADPNATDIQRRSPLHYIAMNKALDSDTCVNALVKRGARVEAQDIFGSTPLALAAMFGREELVDKYLELDKSLIEIRDNGGKYPHDVALAEAGYHALAYTLREKFEGHIKYKEKLAAAKKDEPKLAVPVSHDNWILLSQEKVAHVVREEKIGQKITETFNFRARVYIYHTQNLATNAETNNVKSFDEFSDKTVFEDAFRELTRLGGKADANAIHGQFLTKRKPLEF